MNKLTKSMLVLSATASVALSGFGQARAQTTYAFASTSISYNGRTLSNPAHIIAKDPFAGSSAQATSFLPIWYLESSLKSMGITPQWDGQTLNLIVPSNLSVQYPPTPNPMTLGAHVMSIQINGKTVIYAPKITYHDKGTANLTTFVPVFYLEKAFGLIGIQTIWSGNSWTMTNASSLAVNLHSTAWTTISDARLQPNITGMAYGPDGTLYAVFDSGVYSLSSGTWKLIPGSDQLPAGKITFSPSGVMTITTSKGVYQYQNGKWAPFGTQNSDVQFITFEAQSFNWLPDGELLAGSEGVALYKNGQWQELSLPNNESVQSAQYGPNGTIYAYRPNPPKGMLPGLYVYQSGRWLLVTADSEPWNPPTTAPAYLGHFIVNSDGTITTGDWTMSTSGNWTKNPLPNGVSIGRIYSLPSGGFLDVFESGAGEPYQFWENINGKWTKLGVADGIGLIDGMFTAPQNISISPSDGTIAFAVGNDVYQLQNGIFSKVGNDSVLPSRINALATDSVGNLYVGTAGGLYEWKNGQAIQLSPGVDINGNGILVLKDGTILVVKRENNVDALEAVKGGQFVPYAGSPTGVTSLTESPSGILTIGTQNNGVEQYINGKWQRVGSYYGAVGDVAYKPDGTLTIYGDATTNVASQQQPFVVSGYVNGKWSILLHYPLQENVSLKWLTNDTLLMGMAGGASDGFELYQNGKFYNESMSLPGSGYVGPWTSGPNDTYYLSDGYHIWSQHG